ncbi:hypothetical protein DESA109040_01425 [Deinococcus saxicola]|uniref:ATP-binding domain-containing protein n=1 Tax=Deinococcus saxicola TaxID=249406 RepID=UPI0039EE6744
MDGSTAESLCALTVNIACDVLREGLQLSRNILVVIVGAGASANSMMLKVGEGLKAAGIDFYIPSADIKNLPAGKNPNRFWLDGAVTITTIHRAKGNEADVVYVVGLDEVAKVEGDIQVRNQLFTAMSRSRGWLHLSGSQMAGRPFEREVRQVLASHPTLTIRPSPPPRRMDDDE